MSRYTFIDTPMLEKMPWIHGKKVKSINGLTVMKSNTDFILISTLKLLYPLTRGQLTFGGLYYQSGIRMKKSFLEYLDFCIQMKFIKKLQRDGLNQSYKITDKGHTFLDMFYLK